LWEGANDNVLKTKTVVSASVNNKCESSSYFGWQELAAARLRWSVCFASFCSCSCDNRLSSCILLLYTGVVKQRAGAANTATEAMPSPLLENLTPATLGSQAACRIM